MRTSRADVDVWAREQFADADLGDARRSARLTRMVARAAERPAGRLSEVYAAKELDAAYDFVENDGVSVADLEAVVGRATARLCSAHVLVAVDGSSLSLTPRKTGIEKGFGRIGNIKSAWRGLQVNTALAMTESGTPIGLLAQTYWARPEKEARSAKEKKRDNRRKKPHEKETARWLETIDRSVARLNVVGAKGWFQLDREADAWPTLCALDASGHRFTVRSAWDRMIAAGGEKQYLRARIASTPAVGHYDVDVPERAARAARSARMVIHAGQLTLLLRERKNRTKPRPLTVNIVSAREESETPTGVKPLHWILITNAPIATVADARRVIAGYTTRWRIEEFHRTWKTGSCDVESTQLRGRDPVIRWATILGVVAARVERIKRLSRAEPERPATDELSNVEIRVLLALKRRIKKRTEDVPEAVPTMALAARWLADLGGYTGPSSGGPPGATTIRRGLERVLHGVEAVLALNL